MASDSAKYLFDMWQASELIVQFAEGKSLSEYKRDPYFQSAIERQFQIIGEAMFQLAKRFPEAAEKLPARRDFINFRHVLVHGYDKVEDEIVWGIMKGKLPVLRSALKEMLAPEIP